jgi:NAD(P)-dependent dehydrogenase (short-subunit alcohol dehydrogenase family)
MRNQKVALVTGASSGFGELTARLLAQSGFKVFGASRRKSAIGGGVEMLELDVTLQASVDACIQSVLTRGHTIDLLVNNAGQTHASLVEDTPIETAMGVFDTNFWGVVRVTNAVLPIMRKQRSGLIINVGSLAGLVGVPGQGFYAASKHALEGYTETLQTELQQFDIRVSLVEPGFFRTHLHHSMLRVSRGIPDYDSIRSKIESAISEAISGGGDPRDVAQKILVVARSPTAEAAVSGWQRRNLASTMEDLASRGLVHGRHAAAFSLEVSQLGRIEPMCILREREQERG